MSADDAVLRAAAEAGAIEALKALGLHDGDAKADLKELRELLGAWRDAKRSALRAAIGWVVRLVLALVMVGIAVKAGAWDVFE